MGFGKDVLAESICTQERLIVRGVGVSCKPQKLLLKGSPDFEICLRIIQQLLMKASY
jgi:hypothetical protein